MLHLITPLAAADSPSFLQGDNIIGLLVFLFSVLVCVVALGMAGKSNKGKLKEQAERTGNVFLAVIVLALGVGGMFLGLGEEIINFFLG